ncbi:Membrane-bound lytic murein transglycosylase C [bioreactor metagenome]|uniref:Membrane-bound lytic murein transglycosylase C n=1 Tax=bioreactor metagenome TaxID=1076179 RepID=A0A645F3X0_9ZZZZ|nr:lytic transglycosylase domain-containing protein [Oscillospiraceae bacterium]
MSSKNKLSSRRKNKNNHTGIRTILAILAVAVTGAAAVIVYIVISYKPEEIMLPLMYEENINKYSEEYSIPAYTIYSVIKCESSFNPDAVSRAGAIGLMQIMPSTFEWLCEFTGEDCDPQKLYDPDTNIKYGTMFLSRLYAQFGSWDIVHAAYNAGQGRVLSWLSDDRYSKDGKLTDIPIKETKAYLSRINQYKELYKSTYASKGWNDYDDNR